MLPAPQSVLWVGPPTTHSRFLSRRWTLFEASGRFKDERAKIHGLVAPYTAILGRFILLVTPSLRFSACTQFVAAEAIIALLAPCDSPVLPTCRQVASEAPRPRSPPWPRDSPAPIPGPNPWPPLAPHLPAVAPVPPPTLPSLPPAPRDIPQQASTWNQGPLDNFFTQKVLFFKIKVLHGFLKFFKVYIFFFKKGLFFFFKKNPSLSAALFH